MCKNKNIKKTIIDTINKRKKCNNTNCVNLNIKNSLNKNINNN